MSSSQYFGEAELGLISNMRAWKVGWQVPGDTKWWDRYPEIKKEVFKDIDPDFAKLAFDIVFTPWAETKDAKLPLHFEYLKESESELIVEGLEKVNEDNCENTHTSPEAWLSTGVSPAQRRDMAGCGQATQSPSLGTSHKSFRRFLSSTITTNTICT